MSQTHLPKKMVDMVGLEKILVKQVQVCPVSGFFLKINFSWEKKESAKNCCNQSIYTGQSIQISYMIFEYFDQNHFQMTN